MLLRKSLNIGMLIRNAPSGYVSERSFILMVA